MWVTSGSRSLEGGSCHESVSCSSPIHYKRSPSSRTHYLDSIHLSLIIKPSAEPYDHRLHVLLTHHFARLFTHLPDCLFPHLSSLCLLSGVGTSHNISLKSAWNPALLAPWIFPVYVYRAFGFPLRGWFDLYLFSVILRIKPIFCI